MKWHYDSDKRCWIFNSDGVEYKLKTRRDRTPSGYRPSYTETLFIKKEDEWEIIQTQTWLDYHLPYDEDTEPEYEPSLWSRIKGMFK